MLPKCGNITKEVLSLDLYVDWVLHLLSRVVGVGAASNVPGHWSHH